MKDSNDTEWTDETLRIAIATACGWHGIDAGDPKRPWGADREGVFHQLPNYPSDLNACHEAFQYLVSISKPWAAFRQPDAMFELHLMDICNPGTTLWDNGTFLGSVFDGLETANATARQRCLAFVKTLGLSPEKKD